MDDFGNLIVWNQAVERETNIYEQTTHFTKYELYGLASQVRRSAVSISSNIAEGDGRRSKKEFANFSGISYGLACELEPRLLIAKKLNYLKQGEFDTLFSELNEI